MFDIDFYMKVYDLKKQIMQGLVTDKKKVREKFEEYRSKDPIVFNIETTNACNMKCEMCPRTTLMTRPIKTMDMDIFKRIIQQIKPFTDSKWQEWEVFVEQNYKIKKNEINENHFFLCILPKVLVLHGYGDPLLDRHMPERIKFLAKRKVPTYFSCNPANIKIDKSVEIFENGLDYIKYSIESVDDVRHKEIRGHPSDFTSGYEKIMQLLSIKKKQKYKITFIITMLNLNRDLQNEEFLKLQKAFEGQDVYIYLKSQDQRWYRNPNRQTTSLHWSEFCQFPWSSVTIQSDGLVVPCIVDYNSEIVLGDVRRDSLYDIWNGEEYRNFRQDHFTLEKKIKCFEKCDLPTAGGLI